jgi:hypothetical protein
MPVARRLPSDRDPAWERRKHVSWIAIRLAKHSREPHHGPGALHRASVGLPSDSGRLFANARFISLSAVFDFQLLMAYERGERKELGHLQGIARLLTHESYKEKLCRWLRAALLLSTGMCRAKIGLVCFHWARVGTHGRLRPEGLWHGALPLLRVP